MNSPGQAVVLKGGKRGVRPGGKAGVYDAQGRCSGCCGKDYTCCQVEGAFQDLTSKCCYSRNGDIQTGAKLIVSAGTLEYHFNQFQQNKYNTYRYDLRITAAFAGEALNEGSWYNYPDPCFLLERQYYLQSHVKVSSSDEPDQEYDTPYYWYFYVEPILASSISILTLEQLAKYQWNRYPLTALAPRPAGSWMHSPAAIRSWDNCMHDDGSSRVIVWDYSDEDQTNIQTITTTTPVITIRGPGKCCMNESGECEKSAPNADGSCLESP